MIRNPMAKALITAAMMIAVALLIDYRLKNHTSNWQYLAYLIYAAGIGWVMIPHAKANHFNLSFGQLFSSGFRCFILITLLMVGFTFAFLHFKPAIRQEAMDNYRNELAKQPDLTPAEAEKNIAGATKYFDIMMLSMAIFGYLFTGALITLLIALLIIVIYKGKNNPQFSPESPTGKIT